MVALCNSVRVFVNKSDPSLQYIMIRSLIAQYTRHLITYTVNRVLDLTNGILWSRRDAVRVRDLSCLHYTNIKYCRYEPLLLLRSYTFFSLIVFRTRRCSFVRPPGPSYFIRTNVIIIITVVLLRAQSPVHLPTCSAMRDTREDRFHTPISSRRVHFVVYKKKKIII
jgi:hypothetical protein